MARYKYPVGSGFVSQPRSTAPRGTSLAKTSNESAVPLPGSRARGALDSVDHLRKVQRVTDAALDNLSVDALLDELLIRVREALSADTAAILLLDEARGELV